jgi:hypothetical protein
MWRVATAVAERHGGGVSCSVPLLIRLSRIVRTTPALAYGHGFPSLSKEGSSAAPTTLLNRNDHQHRN